MAEGLFLMQRYYGSDEEPSDSPEISFSIKSSNKDKECSTSPKRKKRKSSHPLEENTKYSNEIVVSSHAEIDNLDGAVSQLSNDSFNSKSKRSNIIQNYQNEVNFKPQNGDILDNAVSSVDNERQPKKKKRKPSKKNINNKILLQTDTNGVKSESDAKAITEETTESLVECGSLPTGENETFCVIGEKKNQNREKIKPSLPKWLSNPTVITIYLNEKEIPVSELSYLDDCSKSNLNKCGIKFLFPVQLAVIPWLMQTNERSLLIRPSDLCVSAPTGSGKTLAFVIPIVQSLKDRVVCAIRAMVVLPVGELAMQVYKVFEMFVRGTDLKVVLLTGSKSFTAEQNALVKHSTRRVLSLADIIVTTPGRILDHINRTEGFSLQDLRYLVIDEADHMIEDIQKGWLKQIEEAVYKDNHISGCVCFSIDRKRLSSSQSTACSFGYINQPLQKLLYSATLSHDPEKLHILSLYRPKLFISKEESCSDEWIGKSALPDSLILQHIVCTAETKPIVLCHYIKQHEFKKILCFTGRVERAKRLTLVLGEMGFLQSREISSSCTPVQRKIILSQFCAGKLDILICSDLVARGMDIEDVDCVVIYDLPLLIDTYIHRIGRTARAGKSGTAVTLVTKGELPRFKKMLKSAEIPLPLHVPVQTQDLEAYVESFQTALKTVDVKLRQQKKSTDKWTSLKKSNPKLRKKQE